MTEPGAVGLDGIALPRVVPGRRRLVLPSAAALTFGGVIGWSAFLLNRVFAGDADAGATPTVLTVGTRAAEGVDPLLASGWQRLVPTVAPLTDDFMDVLRFLRPLW